MLYRVLADAVVLAHTLFVAFVVLGGFLVWRWGWVTWAHVPAALWGAAIEWFVEHHVIPLLYPPGLTAPTQVVLGTLVVVVNLVAYGVVVRRMMRSA